MSSLVITTEQALQTFLELGMILKSEVSKPHFSELFQKFKNLKNHSDIIDFISESVISIEANIRELFASIGIHISDEQLESLPEMYYSWKYWIKIFTEYVFKDNKKKDSYADKHKNIFIPLVDLIEFLKSFYSNDSFTVFIRTLDGRSIDIVITNRMTIEEMKMIIQKNTRIPVDQQIFIFGTRRLDDTTVAGMYNIIQYSTINFILSLRGGMYHNSSTGKLIMDKYEIMYIQMKKDMSRELCKIFDKHFEYEDE
jgi:hypothetical protein